MKIKPISILICFFVLLLGRANGQQLIQGTIKSGAAANQVEIWLKPNFSNSTLYLFQIGLPIAFPTSTTPPPSGITVTLDPTFIANFGNNYNITINPAVPNTVGDEKYFNIVMLRSGSTAQTWTSGVEFKVLTVSFQGSPALTQIKLADYADGGSDGQGLFYSVDQNNTYYMDQSGDSRLNFYPTGGATGSTTGGTITAGFAQTASLISLPVHLLNFSGYKNGGKNTLNWTVATEVNNKGFDVLRSTDGVNYSSIGFVNSQVGGNSNSEVHYTFDDNSPVGVKQYYQLSQKDFDGRSKQSQVIMLSREKANVLGIGGLYPNPASTVVNVMIDAPQRDNVTLLITDMGGKTVRQQQASVGVGSNTIPVDIANLAGGTYLVKLSCQASDCNVAAAKFNKQ